MRTRLFTLLAAGACLVALGFAGCGERERAGGVLADDLKEAAHVPGDTGCTPFPYEVGLWHCSIESDPGSGWSGSMHLRVGKRGCWRARHVRWEPKRKAPPVVLSFDEMHPFGRTFSGCSDVTLSGYVVD